jgi:hypothetical protein
MGVGFDESGGSLKSYPQMTRMAADDVDWPSARSGDDPRLSAGICVICGSFFYRSPGFGSSAGDEGAVV